MIAILLLLDALGCGPTARLRGDVRRALSLGFRLFAWASLLVLFSPAVIRLMRWLFESLPDFVELLLALSAGTVLNFVIGLPEATLPSWAMWYLSQA